MDYRLLSIGALLCWGAWGFLTKLVSKDTSAQTVAFWATLSSLLPITLFAATSGPNRWLKPSPLAVLSGLAAGIATICFYLAIKRGPASVVMPLTGMYILIPALLGIVILKEPISVSHILGLVCAALAVFFLTR